MDRNIKFLGVMVFLALSPVAAGPINFFKGLSPKYKELVAHALLDGTNEASQRVMNLDCDKILNKSISALTDSMLPYPNATVGPTKNFTESSANDAYIWKYIISAQVNDTSCLKQLIPNLGRASTVGFLSVFVWPLLFVLYFGSLSPGFIV